MKAVQFEAYGSPPRVVDVAEPRCPPDGVVIEVGATGLCRSDWHAWRGHETVALPHIPGHEFAGVIAAVGERVRSWTVGERVTAPFVLGCGICEQCRAGAAQVCTDQRQPGFSGPGSFAERVAVERADFNLVALPAGLDFVTAASLGCRFATAFRALTAHARVGTGQWVAVFGCGGVGLSAVMIATALGAQVVAVDAFAGALERATAIGAVATVEAGREPDTAGAVIAATDGGAHVSMDAAGSAATAIASVRSLRRRGRHVQVGLLHGADATPALAMDRVIAFELELYGSHGMAARDYPAMLELVESGALQPRRLVGSVIDLNGTPDALMAMDAPGADGITVVAM
ncbi:MAG: zinc-dependent alcohol dehydrogenase family protein [Candidatus Dormibacteraeota bacterium]|uniref:Zinc-dependent alcohol dehydrogenase family protein n=1 Tax=Candidatus Aeolococcus gillhamiae TaxID=3127015 RepID=A0A934K1H7_9BACT|nr:zinc-dependent alcohol dehydrogenase family protein [Candidatus Dormibacteraeota bacterium]